MAEEQTGSERLGFADTIGGLRALEGKRVFIAVDPGGGSSLSLRGKLGDFHRTGEESVGFVVGEGRAKLRFKGFAWGSSWGDGVLIHFEDRGLMLVSVDEETAAEKRKREERLAQLGEHAPADAFDGLRQAADRAVAEGMTEEEFIEGVLGPDDEGEEESWPRAAH